jgi:peroxiredoxin
MAEITDSAMEGMMVKTASVMLPLGTKAPDFSLLNPVDGRLVSMSDFDDKPALLVIFMCNHCPFVKHLADGLARFARDYQPRGLGMVAISSNDVASYPDDSPDKMKEEAAQRGYTFPYLFDESQSVAHAYRAACTPDFFLFDADRRLVYRGQFDSSRPDSGIPVTGEDLRRAADAVLSGQPVSTEQRPSIGCNIKWKPGLEPDYFKPAGVAL